LAGYYAGGDLLDAKCANLNDVERGIEDRNRTAPFPFCGNRFEFRAVGSSQSCAFPMAVINTAFADGMRALSELLEGGMAKRDAVAQLFSENKRVVFCGNGYAAEWPVEAEKRGLPNLTESVAAHAEFHTPESVALFERMGVLTEEEVAARADGMFENYAAVLEVEAHTLVEMVRTGVEPALEKDLNVYVKPAGTLTSVRFEKRLAAYNAVSAACDELEAAVAGLPAADGKTVATYCRDSIKPLLASTRATCDAAEKLCAKDLWPFPSYTDCCFGHHFDSPKA
jgi:glutamine synthetase